MAGKEVRRLQIVGKSTFAVTLPKEWVESLGWSKGTPLLVERLPDGSIRVAPAAEDKEPDDRELVIDVDALRGGTGTLVRLLVSGYIAGFDVIRVSFTATSKPSVDEARRIAESIMLGFVAVEETGNTVIFQSIADVGRIDLLGALSRQARVAYSMLKDVAAALEGDSYRLGLVAERDQVVDRLYLYIARQLSLVLQGIVAPYRLGLSSQAEALHYIVASKSIERVADHAVILAGKLSGSASVNAGLRRLLQNVTSLFHDSAESLTRLDVSLASAAAARGEMIRDEIDAMLRRGPDIPAYLLENVKRIVGYSLDISEAAIDVAVLRGELPLKKNVARERPV